MGEFTSQISWLAVVVGAVAAFLAGWLWYSPILFGKKWAEGVGVDLGSADEMPVTAMIAQAFGLLLMSWFIGALFAKGLVSIVFLGTLAFTVLAYSGSLFTRKSPFAANVDAGYWLLAMVIMMAAQTLL